MRGRGRRCTTSAGRARPAPSRAGRTRPTVVCRMLRAVGSLHVLLLAPHRQLPADVGLGGQRVHAGAQGHPVQGAAAAARVAGPVEEHAGAVDGAGPQRADAVLGVVRVVLLGPGRRGPTGASCQSSSVRSPTAAVTRARSSSSVKNAPWLQQPSSGRPSTTPAQPAAVDAGPGRRQPGEIGAHAVLRVGGIGELHPLPREVEGDLVGRLVGHAASVGRGSRDDPCRSTPRDDGGHAKARSAERPGRLGPCGSEFWTSARTPSTSWWSTPTAARTRRRCTTTGTVLRLAEHVGADDDAVQGRGEGAARGGAGGLRPRPRSRAATNCWPW